MASRALSSLRCVALMCAEGAEKGGDVWGKE